MHIHILGICGTFMGSLALLARALGHQVTGSDQNVYPPMSTQLKEQGITLIEGYDAEQLSPAPDLVLIGNALSRGNPCVEAVLDQGLRYCSGSQWLHDEVLNQRWVLAVSGTHGKTTTSGMLAWILEYAGMQPGFLIGGVPLNFDGSARLGGSDFFVIEADEYDTAFFDKRSKFVHYQPKTLVINSVEFDHADIFDDLAAVERQFHHLVRIVPQTGQIIAVTPNPSIDRVLEQGCWTPVLRTAAAQSDNCAAWIEANHNDDSVFNLMLASGESAVVRWTLQGQHNQLNALNAALAARHVGVPWSVSAEALSVFKSVKRRMELLGTHDGISVYDDFAHHPTAIETTLAGLRARVGAAPIVAVIEPRSNTMKRGVFQKQLALSARSADQVYWYQPEDQNWSLATQLSDIDNQSVYRNLNRLKQDLLANLAPGTHLVLMSNGGFGGLHHQLLEALEQRADNKG